MEIIFFLVFVSVILPEIKRRAEGRGRRTSFTDSGAQVTWPQESAQGPWKAAGGSGDWKALAKMLVGGAAGVLGAAGAALMAAVMCSVIASEAGSGRWPELLGNLGIFAVLGAASWQVSRFGFRLLERTKNFRLYSDIIGDRDTCPLMDVARASGRSVTVVKKDLKEMVRRGYFVLGFVDDETGAYYASNEAYRRLNPERARQQDEKLRKGRRKAAKPAANEEVEAQPEPEAALPELLEESRHFLQEFDREAAQLDDGPVSRSAGEVRRLAKAIFAWAQEHPACLGDVRRFCSYYLPTTVKLLATYNDVAPHTSDSGAAAGVKAEVEQVLETIRKAFQTLLDDLVEDAALDISAEISALETVMTQEGLTQDQSLARH